MRDLVHARRRGRWRLLAVLVLIVGAGAAGVVLAPDSHGLPRPASVAAHLPAPSRGFAVPRARGIDARSSTRWAPVLRATVVRASPSFRSEVRAPVDALTPEGTTDIVDVAAETWRAGREWVRVNVAALPNGISGWMPRSALGGWRFVSTRVVVDRARLTLTLYRAGRAVFRTRVGVGAVGSPTPAGRFYVRDRLTKYASPEYGPVAFGTSARSPYETGWPAGGFIGIHGTDQPQLIPGRISHGCIRLRNSDIRTLARLMPVGTPVIVR